MFSDWLSPVVGGVVGLAGLVFGWLTSKRSREQAERLAAQANEHARLLSEQSDAHARRMEEERRAHDARLVQSERRQQQIKDAYVQIMTTVRLISEELNNDEWPPDVHSRIAAHSRDLAQASALADTFASDEVLRLFDNWREIVAAAFQAVGRFQALKNDAPDGATAATSTMWRRRLRDQRLRATDARQALADAVASEVGARSGRKRGAESTRGDG